MISFQIKVSIWYQLKFFPVVTAVRSLLCLEETFSHIYLQGMKPTHVHLVYISATKHQWIKYYLIWLHTHTEMTGLAHLYFAIESNHIGIYCSWMYNNQMTLKVKVIKMMIFIFLSCVQRAFNQANFNLHTLAVRRYKHNIDRQSRYCCKSRHTISRNLIKMYGK